MNLAGLHKINLRKEQNNSKMPRRRKLSKWCILDQSTKCHFLSLVLTPGIRRLMPGVTPRSGHTNARDCLGILV